MFQPRVHLAASYSALMSAPSLVSLAVLLLNDTFLKSAFPSTLTGKLSDFAGLYFFPFLLLVAVFGVLRGLPLRRGFVVACVAYVVIGALFTALKLSAETAAVIERTAGRAGFPMTVVADATDIVALIVLLPSLAAWRRRVRPPEEGRYPGYRPARYAVLCAALFATVATSTPQPRISYVAADAVTPGRLYVVLTTTAADGVYSSVSDGRWTRLAPTSGQLFADALEGATTYVVSGGSWDPALHRIRGGAVDSVKPPSPPGRRPQPLYIVGADHFESTAWAAGTWFFVRNGDLLRTSDHGITWSAVATPGPVDALAAAGTPGRLYVAVERTIYGSDDGGARWRQLSELPGRPDTIATDPRRPDLVIAGVGKDLLRSEDAGVSWTVVYSDTGPASANLFRWVIRFARTSDRVFVVPGFGCCALLASTDRGLSWSDAGIRATDVLVDASDTPYAVGSTGTRIYRHDSGNAVWVDVTGDLPVRR